MKIPYKYKSSYFLIGSLIALFITLFYINELANLLMHFTSHKFEGEPVLLSFDDYVKNLNIIMHGGLCVFSLLFLSSTHNYLLYLANAKNKRINFSKCAIIALKAFTVFVCITIILKNLKGEIISVLSYFTIYIFIAGLCVLFFCVMVDFFTKTKN